MNLDSKIRNKKVIFLDLDNTLYAYEPCHQAGLKAAFNLYRKTVEKISYGDFFRLYQKSRGIIHRRLKDQAASHSRLLYFQTLLENRFGKTMPVKALALENQYWKVYFTKMKLKGWVLPFLKKAQAQKKKIMIVTNLTSKLQLKKIQYLKIKKWIDFVVTSEEAGREKPHAKFFACALQKARCKAQDVLVIGDDPHCDSNHRFDCITL